MWVEAGSHLDTESLEMSLKAAAKALLATTAASGGHPSPSTNPRPVQRDESSGRAKAPPPCHRPGNRLPSLATRTGDGPLENGGGSAGGKPTNCRRATGRTRGLSLPAPAPGHASWDREREKSRARRPPLRALPSDGTLVRPVVPCEEARRGPPPFEILPTKPSDEGEKDEAPPPRPQRPLPPRRGEEMASRRRQIVMALGAPLQAPLRRWRRKSRRQRAPPHLVSVSSLGWSHPHLCPLPSPFASVCLALCALCYRSGGY